MKITGISMPNDLFILKIFTIKHIFARIYRNKQKTVFIKGEEPALLFLKEHV